MIPLEREELFRNMSMHITLLYLPCAVFLKKLSLKYLFITFRRTICVRDLTQAPLLLTTISRDWRRIAIGTPALWQSLHIPSQISSPAMERRTMGSTLWLERSRSLPISISLSLESIYRLSPESARGRHTYVETLLKFSSRVKELIFTGSFDDMAHLDALTLVSFPTRRPQSSHSHVLFNGCRS
ncbi:hypothetical protein BT96DRAFT_61856 [Gymnopus androsaceus JB14]|uniref:F-box domain-containing protein n=1 Tax=Gymnopus androsaceus JB14 TaxID=1447944 RepID=A0A6A4HJW6_9AGAR|nr:hypothetical protein BT96DRAFT_509913 [Gymnopus androsaceus JB14]KAE9397811.1 hypothetical protein BT96DRAFT_61856 [Gymnopus androsaceus JB14]